MSAVAQLEDVAVTKISHLLHAIQELVHLEEQSQEVLKQPVEQLLDTLPDSLNRLEEKKTKWMRTVDRYAIELTESRRKRADGPDKALDEAQSRLMLALRGLQRIHQDNERILRLRMTLLSEDMRQVERSRRFLRSTLQSVAV
jgi:predicted  nucleic acid-binding Zn-ribbon protein